MSFTEVVIVATDVHFPTNILDEDDPNHDGHKLVYRELVNGDSFVLKSIKHQPVKFGLLAIRLFYAVKIIGP
jgi:hypothetical protein